MPQNPWPRTVQEFTPNTSIDAPMLPLIDHIAPEGIEECTGSRAGGCVECLPSRQRRDAGWVWDTEALRWVAPRPIYSLQDYLRSNYTRPSLQNPSGEESAPPIEDEEILDMPMPYDIASPQNWFYCERCDSRMNRDTMQLCDLDDCREALCAPCFSEHVHNGDWCAAHGFNLLNGGQAIFCETHDDWFCAERHNRLHVGCALGGYEPRDDGRYSGRPPVDGFGREASLSLLDGMYIEDDIVTHQRAAALELEVEYAGVRSDPNAERLVLPGLTGITHDGSLNNGIEVTTPPAKGAVLRDVVESTCYVLREGGYEAQDTCGMHTHIDLRDYKDDKKFLSHLFNAFFAVEDILYAMQREPRHNSTFSVPLRNMYKFFDMYGQMSGDFEYTFYKQPKTFDGKYNIEREKEGKYSGVRYAAFNFHSVFYRGSLECRIHEGNVDGEVALQWINLLQTIIARVERGHSYATMKKLAQMKVTPQKVKMFARYFGLTKTQRDWVHDRINRGQGYNFRLPESIMWGTPRRGRPRGEPREPRYRLSYVGHEVRCYNCGGQWELVRRSTFCPFCRRRLIDAYGGLNYTRVPLRLRRRSAPQPPPTYGEPVVYNDLSSRYEPLAMEFEYETTFNLPPTLS